MNEASALKLKAQCACWISRWTRRRVAFASNSTIIAGTCFSRTSHYAMNTQHFDRAS